MAGVRLEFAQFGHFDSFEVIRSLTSMAELADHELPAPIATDLKTMYYVDGNVVEGQAYYYRVRVRRQNETHVSSEVKCVASFDADVYFNNVDVLLLSENGFVNLTGKTTVSENGNEIVATSATSVIPKFSDKLFFINRKYFSVDFTAILTTKFTFEFWGCPNFSNTLNWSEWFSFWDNTGFGEGDLYFVRNNNTNKMTSARTGKTPILTNGDVVFDTNELRHICVMSDGITIAVFVDGVINKTFAYSAFSRQWMVFRKDFSSYIESLRLTRNVARYDMSGFMPPDKKFSKS